MPILGRDENMHRIEIIQWVTKIFERSNIKMFTKKKKKKYITIIYILESIYERIVNYYVNCVFKLQT